MTKLFFTALFSCAMSSMVSAWVTYINLGLTEDFISRWGFAFINAWPASFAAAYLLNKPIMVLTQKLMRQFTTQKEKNNA
ncbi:DUF2798 domain-containing protein [Vibrio sagamiensis]|uniref:DUF2798 domain-containing protein n=1 Tax=Vibrio sagamiensis NBRC 104589 TaxID=1219064 RepID=A0A511QJ88_9VIBR|nr:DUF2798 domain-containing protein [Vibrio sagamiensis]PNQ54491.1 DUF2798 domain-containing protein [Vibrio agarivorans]GEM77395.1 hypothetical protein VSA01S_35070 [Vibrio sagamiensis NBRC 104589]